MRQQIQLYLFLTLLLFFTGTLEAQDEMPRLVQTGKIKSKHIDESSGLVLASNNALWTINDSGNRPELYLLANNGKLLLTVVLNNAKNQDWEALAKIKTKNGTQLIVGDVGDNRAVRSSVRLYIVDEPDLSKIKSTKIEVAAVPIEFQYEDGPRNCEAILFDKDANCLWLFEKVYMEVKRKSAPGIYRLSLASSHEPGIKLATRIADFPVRNVTGADISNDGQSIIVRNYINAHYLTREPTQDWAAVFHRGNRQAVPCPLQRQGEAICFDAAGASFFLTSELAQQPIWQVTLPKSVLKQSQVPKKKTPKRLEQKSDSSDKRQNSRDQQRERGEKKRGLGDQQLKPLEKKKGE